MHQIQTGRWRPSPLALITILVGAGLVMIGIISVMPAALVGLVAMAGLAYLALSIRSAPLIIWASLLYLEAIRIPNLAIKLLMPVLILALVRPMTDPANRHTAGPDTGRDSALFSLTVAALGLFSVWLMASINWAIDPVKVAESVIIWVPMVAVFLAIVYRPPTVADIRLVGLALTVGALVSVLGGIFLSDSSPAFAHAEQGRLQGGAGDPNFLAAGLPTAFLFAIVWWAKVRHRLVRLALVGVMGVLLVGLVLTISRGGLVATASLVPVAVAFAGPRRGRVAAGLLAIGLVVTALIFVTPAADRIFGRGDGGAGRSELWAIAGEMIAEQPVQGVGVENFPVVAQDHVREVGQLGEVDLIVNKPHQVHNLYLQIASELGLVGITLYLTFAAGSVACAFQAGKSFSQQGDPAAALLARGVAMGGISIMVAATFLPFLYDKRFWLVLALGPALDRLSTPPPTPGPGNPPGRGAPVAVPLP